MAQFCKRRQQLVTEETQALAFFVRDTIKTNSLVHVAAHVNFENSTDPRIRN